MTDEDLMFDREDIRPEVLSKREKIKYFNVHGAFIDISKF